MSRESLIEMSDRVNLRLKFAGAADSDKNEESVVTPGGHAISLGEANVGPINRFFASGPIWSRQVDFFEVGECRAASLNLA